MYFGVNVDLPCQRNQLQEGAGLGDTDQLGPAWAAILGQAAVPSLLCCAFSARNMTTFSKIVSVCPLGKRNHFFFF